MSIAISPHCVVENGLGPEVSLDLKIDIFVDRVYGWQLNIAKQMIEKGIEHCGFAILHILMSYFEMIGKYQDGYAEDDASKCYFKKGMKITFPEIGDEADNFLADFYEKVRCGLYHAGMTKANVYLNDGIPGSIGYQPDNKLIQISPTKLVYDLITRFNQYSDSLRNKENLEIRRNFETRFDHDNFPPEK